MYGSYRHSIISRPRSLTVCSYRHGCDPPQARPLLRIDQTSFD